MFRSGLAALGAAAAVCWWAAGAVSAQEVEFAKTVGGLQFYLGVIPAALVRDTYADHHAESMHGGVPRGARMQHVMVAIFDQERGQRVTDAKVTARVEEPGHFGNEGPLEPMSVAGAVTYGNYFPMTSGRTYEIRVHARIPGAREPVMVVFSYRLSSALPSPPQNALVHRDWLYAA
jgi:hypothetical protein